MAVVDRVLTPEQLTHCARAALSADFDPVAWESAPEWRRQAAEAVARAALLSKSPDQIRAAWLTQMVAMGWRWDRELDEQKKTHPGIVTGDLTGGGTRHWNNVIAQVRQAAQSVGAPVYS